MEQLWKKEFPHCGAIVEFVGIPQLTHSFNKVWNTLIFSYKDICVKSNSQDWFHAEINEEIERRDKSLAKLEKIQATKRQRKLQKSKQQSSTYNQKQKEKFCCRKT